MGRNEQSEPIMDGSTEATHEEKRDGLAAQVEFDHRDASDDGADDFAERARQAGLDGAASTDEGRGAGRDDEGGAPLVSREPA